jgi:gliding motility-associated transport system permease protein
VQNILAIANKELRSYFNSPIAYAVIGFFAFAFGFMYLVYLYGFIDRSMQMSMGQMGMNTINVNQVLIRPLVMQLGVIWLFLLPMVTMRAYAEEKRSGTIELLLTAPLTDLQIILGKFLGALGLYAAMLAATIPAFAILFAYGNPDWLPLVTTYLGLLLFGAAFLALGLFLSSTTQNQIVAGAATFMLLLMLLLVGWLRDFTTWEPALNVISALSIYEHLDDFTKGVIDTKHIAYYVSIVTLGLFLTARSVDSERWRG